MVRHVSLMADLWSCENGKADGILLRYNNNALPAYSTSNTHASYALGNLHFDQATIKWDIFTRCNYLVILRKAFCLAKV